ncbi:MAG: hypothetical protein Q4E75_01550 [bacterium]|nr:hypothetical protein [bacterium]
MENQKNSKGIIALLVVIIVILLALVVLIGTGMVSFKSSTSANNQQNSGNNIVNNEQSNTINETNDIDNNANSSSNAVSQKSSVSKSQILSYYKERISAFSDSNHQYSIIDINNDDIPELFIYVTGRLGNQIIADTSVFTYDENKGDKSNNYIVGVGTVSGRIDNDTILYKMNDGRLLSVHGHMGYESTTYFKLENDWLIRTDFASKQTDNYMSGDNAIQFKPCTDTSLIDNFS